VFGGRRDAAVHPDSGRSANRYRTAGGSRIGRSPAALVGVLRIAAGSGNSTTQASALIAGLPVAGWSGTLATRYTSGDTAATAGDARAKTGSLDGVTTLAGFVHDRSGRLLVFSLDADHTPLGGTLAAEHALDRVVTALAGCGCA